jgi:deazaflavin-dependent oxidoreductase (nitroreductase family)
MTGSQTKTLPLPQRAARRVIAASARPHRWLYQRYGGRLLNRGDDSSILMLTTTGRKSGQPRSALLIHVKDGDDFIVVGSNWGQDKPPAWLLNLQADPEATVTVAQKEHRVIAQWPEGAEQERCWALLTEKVTQLPQVAENANRELPVVKLVRT